MLVTKEFTFDSAHNLPNYHGKCERLHGHSFKIELAITEKNVWLERVYEIAPVDLEEVAHTYEGYAQRLRPYITDTSLLVDRALRNGDNVLFEGAQGTLLDLDHDSRLDQIDSAVRALGKELEIRIVEAA